MRRVWCWLFHRRRWQIFMGREPVTGGTRTVRGVVCLSCALRWREEFGPVEPPQVLLCSKVDDPTVWPDYSGLYSDISDAEFELATKAAIKKTEFKPPQG